MRQGEENSEKWPLSTNAGYIVRRRPIQADDDAAPAAPDDDAARLTQCEFR
jgi:hypothetical protein